MDNKQLFRCLMIGFVLIGLGWITIFVMVIGLLKPTFFLNFLGYSLSLAGLLFGILAIVMYKK